MTHSIIEQNRNANRNQWITTLETYVFPFVGHKPVDELRPADFAEALKPIWLDKQETASRVKQRCHAVMKWAWGRELVSGNPVDIVDTLLPKQAGAQRRVTHLPSMPWRDIPDFMKSVVLQRTNVTRLLLEFVILTAARSGEARGMTWDEVDFEQRVWTIPAVRMKTGMPHRVPLSQSALAILELQKPASEGATLVFPSSKGKQLTDMVADQVLARSQSYK
jgi:integrase